MLLIRLRSIGDTVLMTPCLAALKSWRPEIHTTVLLEETAAPLLTGHELVDCLMLSPETFTGKMGLVRQLRRKRFDISINLHGGTTATFLAALSGARFTLGYAGHRYSGLLNRRAPSPDLILGKKSIHSVEQQLALLRWAGVPWPADAGLNLPVSEQASASVAGRLAIEEHGFGNDASSYAIISPAGSDSSKRWPASSFGLVAEHLYDFWRLKSLVIAGRGEEDIAQEVASFSGGAAHAIFNLSLPELAALISKANLFIGNDSGPMHIAAAFGRPMVAIFGSSNRDVWSPWSTGPSRVLSPGKVGGGSSESAGESAHANRAVSTEPSGPESFPIGRISASEAMKAVDEVIEEALCSAHD